MSIRVAILSAGLCLAPVPGLAQPSSPDRLVAFADIGFGQTADDEGVLGKGAIVAAGVGMRITDRLTLQALVDRVAYHRDETWLEFDGRVIFTGVEAAFHYSPSSRVQPYWSIGGGFFNDDGTAVWKTQFNPLQPYSEERFDRRYTLAAMTASGGIEVPIARQASVRAGVRFHGLLDTGDDAAPHLMLHPTVGMSWRW